jgi:hypothetical protein
MRPLAITLLLLAASSTSHARAESSNPDSVPPATVVSPDAAASPGTVTIPSAGTSAEHDLTFRGHRFPKTQTFFIVQTGVIYLLEAEDEPARLTMDLGLMRNLGPSWAVGLNGHLESGDGEGGVGLMLRGRRWLGRDASVDLATGFLSPYSEEAYTNGGNTTSWITQAHLNWGNAVSITVQADRWRDEAGPYPDLYVPPLVSASGTNWYVGGTIGYVPGLLALLGFGTLVAATW